MTNVINVTHVPIRQKNKIIILHFVTLWKNPVENSVGRYFNDTNNFNNFGFVFRHVLTKTASMKKEKPFFSWKTIADQKILSDRFSPGETKFMAITVFHGLKFVA